MRPALRATPAGAPPSPLSSWQGHDDEEEDEADDREEVLGSVTHVICLLTSGSEEPRRREIRAPEGNAPGGLSRVRSRAAPGIAIATRARGSLRRRCQPPGRPPKSIPARRRDS